jgi:hypothetical protein
MATPALLGVDVGLSQYHAHPARVASTIRRSLPKVAMTPPTGQYTLASIRPPK